jgi:hypothetical protein
MGHLVKQHEQHVAGYEFRELLTVLCRKTFELWNAAEREGSGIDPGLKIRRCGGPIA